LRDYQSAPQRKAIMMTLHRTANVRGKNPVWPAVILNAGTGQFARLSANAHGKRAGWPTFRRKGIYGVRPLWRGPRPGMCRQSMNAAP
jgi:hypothetical protein